MMLHAVQECQWLNGIMPCSGDPKVECMNPYKTIMKKLNMTFCLCHSFKKQNIEQYRKFIRQSTFRLISFQESAKTQYGFKGNFFVYHFSFIINSVIFIFLPLVFLTTNV